MQTMNAQTIPSLDADIRILTRKKTQLLSEIDRLNKQKSYIVESPIVTTPALSLEIRRLEKRRGEVAKEIDRINASRYDQIKQHSQEISQLIVQKDALQSDVNAAKKELEQVRVQVEAIKPKIVKLPDVVIEERTKGLMDREKMVRQKEAQVQDMMGKAAEKMKEAEERVQEIEKRTNDLEIKELSWNKGFAQKKDQLNTMELHLVSCQSTLSRFFADRDKMKQEILRQEMALEMTNNELKNAQAMLSKVKGEAVEIASLITREKAAITAGKESIEKQNEMIRLKVLQLKDQEETLRRGFEELRREQK